MKRRLGGFRIIATAFLDESRPQTKPSFSQGCLQAQSRHDNRVHTLQDKLEAPSSLRESVAKPRMMETQMLTLLRVDQKEVLHSIRTAVAGVASLLIARFCRLPESYWAAITTIIIMQSTLGAAWSVSKQRFVGTALGAAMGALLTAYAAQNVAAFGAGVFVLGLICALLRIGRNAFRYAAITLAIIMLVARAEPPWMIAVHRFLEISVGIAVGVLLTAVWPEPEPVAV
jgi:uncharacterized membrane protein YccC